PKKAAPRTDKRESIIVKNDSGHSVISSPYAPTSVRPRILLSLRSSLAPARYTRRPKMYASPLPVERCNSSSSKSSAMGSRMLRLSVLSVFPTINNSPGGPFSMKSSQRMMLATALPLRTEPCQMLILAVDSSIDLLCFPVGSDRFTVFVLPKLLHQLRDKTAPTRTVGHRIPAPSVAPPIREPKDDGRYV